MFSVPDFKAGMEERFRSRYPRMARLAGRGRTRRAASSSSGMPIAIASLCHRLAQTFAPSRSLLGPLRLQLQLFGQLAAARISVVTATARCTAILRRLDGNKSIQEE